MRQFAWVLRKCRRRPRVERLKPLAGFWARLEVDLKKVGTVKDTAKTSGTTARLFCTIDRRVS